jgi:2-dehydro-3-deoxyphosphogluconate aldolase / (4S)-4-hydroxy-2-oxoglutarate aldolase
MTASQSHVMDIIVASRLVAIIRLDDLSSAVELAEALLRGGIVAQEYTLTNPEALNAIREIRNQVPAFNNGTATIGVGSVRTADQVHQAAQAGAQFVVSPITDAHVMTACHACHLPTMPGAMTPTEIATAWDLGAAAVKVFPARGLGPNYIADVLAPMPEIKLMPTGGIDESNMAAYFNAGAVAVGVGGNLVNKRLIADRDWNEVERIARQYSQAASHRSSKGK